MIKYTLARLKQAVKRRISGSVSKPVPASAPIPSVRLSEPREPVFALGTGRSGTHFMARLMQEDPVIDSYHLDTLNQQIADSFVCYCAWNNLPVDLEGFLASRQHLVDKAVKAGKLYFESNPYLALSATVLFERLHSRFIFIVRKPEDVVNSHYIKGWYQQQPVQADPDLSLGFQYSMDRPNHFFGRITPRGEAFERWCNLTQIGKIAWMWNTINMEILRQLEYLPQQQYRIVRLQELDYACYRDLHEFTGGLVPMSEQRFEEIRQARPGKGPKHRTADTWTTQEWEEFLQETAQARAIFGFDQDNAGVE
jgi:hypothetical protein